MGDNEETVYEETVYEEVVYEDEEQQIEEGDTQDYNNYTEDEGYFEPYWVRAIYNYEAANDTEISFQENDVVCITADYNDGWWCGDLNGYVGRVPANYFEYLNQDDQTQQQNVNNNYDETTGTYYDETTNGTYDQTWADSTYNTTTNNEDTSQFTNTYQDSQQDQHGDDDDDQSPLNVNDDNERKEKLRLKREQFKKEMKDLQDSLKRQNEAKDSLGLDIDRLEKERDRIEDEIRIFRLLKFINLEIIKLEVDIDVDTDITTQSRQAGITVTQDLKSLRTILNPTVAGGKPQPIQDPIKKQFDSKLEEFEKKFTNNLNNLDVCDNLKKILSLSLTQFQNLLEPSIKTTTSTLSQSSPTSTSSNTSLPTSPSANSSISTTPPPPLIVPILSNSQGLPPPPLSSQLPPPPTGFVVATPSINHPYYTSPIISPTTGSSLQPPSPQSQPLSSQTLPQAQYATLSEKEKKKSLKEAKKIEKAEKKEEKKLEKLEKKDKKKVGDSEDTPLWKSNPNSTSPNNSKK